MTPDPEAKVGLQHDVDLSDDSDDREVDDRPLEEIFAEAMTPEEYVLSSDEAMQSALEQQAAIDAEGAQ